MFDRDDFEPEAHAAENLVYGVGRHVCPGRLLATSQMRITLRALLAAVRRVDFAPGREPEREVSPVGGFRRVWVVLD